jgi:hypothetical protein
VKRAAAREKASKRPGSSETWSDGTAAMMYMDAVDFARIAVLLRPRWSRGYCREVVALEELRKRGGRCTEFVTAEQTTGQMAMIDTCILILDPTERGALLRSQQRNSQDLSAHRMFNSSRVRNSADAKYDAATLKRCREDDCWDNPVPDVSISLPSIRNPAFCLTLSNAIVDQGSWEMAFGSRKCKIDPTKTVPEAYRIRHVLFDGVNSVNIVLNITDFTLCTCRARCVGGWMRG